jgi:tetratricopeptide (TPR) repeat protein
MAEVNQNIISGGVFLNAVIQGQHITVQLPPEVRPALSVPAGSQSFTGRQEALAEVLSALAPTPALGSADSGGRRRAVSVSGMAGVGKTELAIQTSRLARERGWFPGGVLLINLFGYDAQRSLGPAQALEQALRDHLAVPAQSIPVSQEGRARLYAEVLTAYAAAGRPILAIIDNASSREQAECLLPQDTGSGLIVTSRESLGMLGVRRVDLDVLSDDEAVELLRRAMTVARPDDARTVDQPEDARQIVRLCAGLPQAVQIVAALLADNPRQSLASMVADLSDSHSRLAEMTYQGDAIATAFQLSYQRLDPERARVFRLLPVSPGPDVSTGSVSVLADLDNTGTRHALRDLAQANLLMYGITDDRWRLHDLLRLFADEQGRAQAAADHRDEARDRLLDYLVRTATAASQRLTGPAAASIPAFPDAAKALEFLDGERACLVAAVAFARQSDRQRLAAQLALAPAGYLERERRFDDALATLTAARDIGRDLADRETEASALASLVMILQGLRRFDDAIAAGREAVALFVQTGNQLGQAVALTNLGGALQQVRQFNEAIGVLADAAKIYQSLGDSYRQAAVMLNVGVAQHGAGDTTRASVALRTAADLLKQYGDSHRQAIALTSLSSVYFDLGQHTLATAVLTEAIELYRQTGDRHGEGEALCNLAAVHVRDGQQDAAAETSAQAILAFRATDDVFREAQVTVNLATALAAANPAAAIAYYRQAEEAFAQLASPGDLGMAQAAIGGHELQARRAALAIAPFRQAIVNCGLAGDAARQRAARLGLGQALAGLGRLGEAVAVFRDAVATTPASENPAASAAVADFLAKAEAGCDHLVQPIASQREQADQLHAAGDAHGEGMARSNLGRLLLLAGQLNEALAEQDAALALVTNSGDVDSQAIVQGNVAGALLAAGQPAAAAAASGRAAELFAQAGDLPAQARALADSALALILDDRLDEATAAFRASGQALAGAGDLRSQAMMLDELGRALQEAGQPAEAANAYRDALAICQGIGDQEGEAMTSGHVAAATAQGDLAARLAPSVSHEPGGVQIPASPNPTVPPEAEPA